MNATIGILLLAALPPLLMGASHVYAMRSQDRRTACVVIFDARVRDTAKVAADHQRRYGVHVVQHIDAATKGYRGSVPLKNFAALKCDRRVRTVERVDIDDDHANPTRF